MVPIYGFVSWKGGVGRTMVMINSAFEMAGKGHVVGLLDFDFDSGGLVHILSKHQTGGKPDLLEILWSGHIPSIPDAVERVGKSLAKEHNRTIRGEVIYLPTIPDAYKRDYVNFEGKGQIDFLWDVVESFVQMTGITRLLIDTPPGLSEAAAVALPRCNRIVVVTRVDGQNRSGIKQYLKMLRDESKDFLLVANLVWDLEDKDRHLKAFEAEVEHKFDETIYLDSSMAFEEKIMVLENPTGPTAKSIKRLCNKLR
jgi:MinD-like ATPase involved in chromosome partitioning or flagellar assembly